MNSKEVISVIKRYKKIGTKRKKELEEQIEQFDKHQRKRANEVEEDFENPVDEEFKIIEEEEK